MSLDPVIVNFEPPKTPMQFKLPGFSPRASKIITAAAAVIISISMVAFIFFSIATNNSDFKKAHNIQTATDLEQSNSVSKVDSALPGGGIATGVGGTTGTNAPAVTITAQPATVSVGGTAHLKWSVTNNPKSCTATEDWSGAKNASGEETTAALTQVQTYLYTLTCKTATGTGFATVSVGVKQEGGTGDVATRPTVTLGAEPTSVYVGQDSTLQWEVTNNPTSCTASGNWSGAKNATGTQSTGTLTVAKKYTYTLTCTNSSGTAYATIPVEAIVPPPDVPIPSLSISPLRTTTPGSSVQLTWTTTNSPSTCTATDDWSGSKNAAGGTEKVGPLSSIRQYTFTITCKNSAGSNYDSVVIDVLPLAPDVSLTITPAAVTTGGSSTISWSSTNGATGCQASSTPNNNNWNTAKGPSGSVGTGIYTTTGTYFFSLTCTNQGGSRAVSNVPLVVTAPNLPNPPVVTLTASPIAVTSGGSSNLTWNATNTPTSCNATSSPVNANWNGAMATSGGPVSTNALSAAGTYTYSLTCSNAGGPGSATTSVSVSSGGVAVKPVVTVTASPTSISNGNSSTISWNVANTPTSCTASGTGGTWANSPGATGSVSTGSKTTAGTFTYILTCSNSAGSASGQATVTVVAPPTVSISLNPTTITTGTTTNVTWVVSNATSCSASGNTYWTGSKGATGSTQAVGPITTAGTYVFSMACSNAGGTSPIVSAPLTVNNAVYCGGQLPCYGPSTLATHTAVTNCWGYNIDQVFDLTSMNASYHKTGKPSKNLFPTGSSVLCGNASFAAYISGTTLSGVGSHNHLSSTKNNTNATMATYRVGYYDATKP